MSTERQQILHLWLHFASLDAAVTAWAFHDGSDGAQPLPEGDPDTPPYRTGVDALRDGWMLLQAPRSARPDETPVELGAEFVFERRVSRRSADTSS